MRIVTLILCLTLISVVAAAVTVEGSTYQPNATIEGKAFKLIGAGLREKWFVDVYTLGAYSESGACKPADIVGKDEPKYIRIDMKRDVSAEKMAGTISEAFEDHMPKGASADLKAQRKKFEGYFKDECSEGVKLEFLYLPGVGTTIKQNGKLLGPALTGFEFARVFWDIYFGKDTCCDDLKEQILEKCK